MIFCKSRKKTGQTINFFTKNEYQQRRAEKKKEKKK
jgi:hypothetical protein